LKLDQWDDKQTGQKRSRLGVVAEVVQFLGSPRGTEGGAPSGAPARPRPASAAPTAAPAAAPAAEPSAGEAEPPPPEDDVPF
jgi:single-strand DNA-binding protein